MEIITTEPKVNGYDNNNATANNQESTPKAFITANTIESSLEEIKGKHVIPVFVKDNEPVISHADFIECTMDITQYVFRRERILKPSVRVSHEIKGRIPEAKHKPAKELLEHERTLYYERCAFVIEIPSICEDVAGNPLTLTVGGVKSYHLDNLYSKKGTDEHFKVFIGFKNTVCCNMCVWSDGFVGDIKVKNLEQLMAAIRSLFMKYNAASQLHMLNQLTNHQLTEQQFAHLIGRCKMYQYLSTAQKKEIPDLRFGDSQINQVCRDYYKDESFCRDESGDINLWRLYNLFTGANKQSYIDTFLDRAANASLFTSELVNALEQKTGNWFLG